MLVDGSGENGLAFVYDEASEQDSLDSKVVRSWPCGTRALGRKEWLKTLRVALRLHGTSPWTAKENKEHKDELLGLLRIRGIRAVLVLQSPATPGVRQVHSAWNILGHSGNPYKWAGTAERRHDLYVCPLLNPASYEYVYCWLIERWVKQAYGLAQGTVLPLAWPETHLLPGAEMVRALEAMGSNNAPLAVDIETNIGGTIVTAIGLSDDKCSISTPWSGYAIAGTSERQPGIDMYDHGARIKHLVCALLADGNKPKVLHNGAFDVLELAKRAIRVASFEYDTLLLHRVVYPQYRHSLQQACATEFCIEPYKTLHKPPKVSTGQDPWLADPIELRAYNSKDAFATYKLCQSLASKAGVDFSG